MSLACLLATFGVFFGVLSTGAIHTDKRTAAEWFVVCVGAFIALRLVLHLVAAAAACRGPADERGRMIALMAAR